MFRHIVAVLGLFGALWSLAIWLTGGFSLEAGALRIESHDPLRPLALGLAALAYVALSAPARTRKELASIVGARRTRTWLAVLLAVCPAVVGLARNSWTAGGADSYAYVAQAELWLQRRLTIPVPLAAAAPWPDAVSTFAPHGFRPAPSGAALVPVTAPGLPLLMAGAKAVAGHCAMFWVVPISGAWLVWLTFAIGRRMSSDVLGLAAAWLVATSPAVLAMLVSPMSDVPAAAFWTAAIYFAQGGTARSHLTAGAAASAAILVRPNLAPLAAVIVGWRFVGDKGIGGSLLIAAATLPGCLVIAWLNAHLYGSPLESGYGNLASLFSLDYLATNLWRYGGWLVETQTPVAIAGVAALFVPARALWRTPEQQRAAWLLAGVTVTVWFLYGIYTPFDAWWYLRFLLPSWPAMCLGIGALYEKASGASLASQDRKRQPTPLRWIASTAALIAIGLHNMEFAAYRGAFPSGEGDHRYVSIAKIVEQSTEPSSVIFAGQNSGATRYYAGRTALRFDLLDEAWLDRASQWLTVKGRPVYFLIEEWEIPLFQRRFAAQNSLGVLAMAPIVAYQAPGVPGSVFLFNPRRPEGSTLRPAPPAAARAKCVEPAPLLDLK